MGTMDEIRASNRKLLVIRLETVMNQERTAAAAYRAAEKALEEAGRTWGYAQGQVTEANRALADHDRWTAAGG